MGFMQRMRILLLGKCTSILINKPAVEIEDNETDPEACKWEHAAHDLTEMQIPIVTKLVTNDDAVVTEVTIDLPDNLSDLEYVEMNMDTDKEINDTKKSSCSYQVNISSLKISTIIIHVISIIPWPFSTYFVLL